MYGSELSCDVLIIGAGPAGSAAACVLATRGVDVLLVDRSTFPRSKVCGDALTPNAVTALERMGMLDSVLDLAPHPIIGSRHHWPGVELGVDSMVSEREYGRPGYVLRRTALDDTLRRRALSAGARFLDSCVVAEVVDSDGRIVGATGHRHQQRLRVAASVTICATGSPACPTRIVAPCVSRRVAVGARAYFSNVAIDGEWLEFFHDRNLDPGYAWVFPLGDGMANVGYWLYRDRLTAMELKWPMLWTYCKREMHELSQRLGEARQVTPFHSHAVWTGLMDPLVRTGALWIGTAGAAVDPVSGEGISWALESGRLSAEVTSRALFAGDTSEGGLWEYGAAMRSRTRHWVQEEAGDDRTLYRHPYI